MNVSLKIGAALLGLFAATGSAQAGISVDGNLSDWGISLGTDTNWAAQGFTDSATGTFPLPVNSKVNSNINNYKYVLEDDPDSAGIGGQLGPNQGGQYYDAEFLGVGIDATNGNLVIAIATGQRPDNPSAYFSPGDVRIGTSTGFYGVEVGGGAGGLASSGAITPISANNAGRTYNVWASGNGTTTTSSPNGLTAGTVVRTSLSGANIETPTPAGWIADPLNVGNPTGYRPVQLDGTGFVMGTANYIYSWATGSKHAVIEISISAALLGGGSVNYVSWSPSCGNDIVELNLSSNALIPAPVPAALPMMLLGLGVAGFVSKKSRRLDA